jgi:PhoPQ-activated pathogenicity-related protein
MMKRFRGCLLLLAVGLLGVFLRVGSAEPAGKAACTGYQCLYNYVHTPDPTYSWKDTGMRLDEKDWTGYILNMTSQTWLTAKDSSRPVWFHLMCVIVPKGKILYDDFAFLWITGGNNEHGGGTLAANDEDIQVAAYQAVHNGVVAGVLYQVPNQHIVFATDPLQKKREEDATIAFTWDHFIKDTSNPEWLLRFPMTKAAVRAFDTIEAFTKTLKGANLAITRFGVGGASKRGWTTWTTAASDSRVVFMCPVVMDELNMIKNLHHHYKAYGGWSFALRDYFALNFTAHLDDPNTLEMAKIIDAYWFRDRLAGIPKVVINAGMDEFLMPDDTTFWWDAMTEPKHFIMVPNAEHSQATGVFELLPAMSTYMRSVLRNLTAPKMTWTIDPSSGNITLKTNVQPIAVDMWHATTCNEKRRDFRLFNLDDPCTCGVKAKGMCANLKIFWSRVRLEPVAPLTYMASRPAPSDGRWTAFFINAEFEGPKRDKQSEDIVLLGDVASRKRRRLGWPIGVDGQYDFTTSVSIVPNTFPFPDCQGKDCLGHLV